jgi:hypothetical protein
VAAPLVAAALKAGADFATSKTGRRALGAIVIAAIVGGLVFAALPAIVLSIFTASAGTISAQHCAELAASQEEDPEEELEEDPETPQSATAPDCNYTEDTRRLAAQLVHAMDVGRLRGGNGISQIRNIAEGTESPSCGIDIRILQLLAIALNSFDSLGVSDINRFCTNTVIGAGSNSWHYKDGGGRAVDIYALNGTAATGNDANSRALLRLLDPLMPTGTGTGQLNCRTSSPLVLKNMRQFTDTCNHVHIDVGGATGGILAAGEGAM